MSLPPRLLKRYRILPSRRGGVLKRQKMGTPRSRRTCTRCCSRQLPSRMRSAANSMPCTLGHHWGLLSILMKPMPGVCRSLTALSLSSGRLQRRSSPEHRLNAQKRSWMPTRHALCTEPMRSASGCSRSRTAQCTSSQVPSLILTVQCCVWNAASPLPMRAVSITLPPPPIFHALGACGGLFLRATIHLARGARLRRCTTRAFRGIICRRLLRWS